MEESKNIIYTAADLQRYHSGSMNEKEMHALEKAAMEDPFLSDALEGYEFTEAAEKDIIELKMRMQEKEEKKKVFVLFSSKTKAWLSAAAVLVLILSTVYLTLKLNSSKNEVMLAKNGDAKQELASIKKDSGVDIKNEQIARSVLMDSTKAKLNWAVTEPPTAPGKKIPIYTIPSTKANADDKATEPIYNKADGDGALDSLPDNNTTLAEVSPTFADAKQLKKEMRRDAAVDEAVLKDRLPLEYDNFSRENSTHKFSGKVVDEKGNPVAFASVNDSLKRSNFTTDASGYFSIPANDSSIVATIAAVGYNTLKKDLKSNIDQTIVLSRNTQELTAVVVTSMGAVRQKASLGYATTTVKPGELQGKVPGISVASGSEPVIGKLKYNQVFIDSIKNSLTVNKKLIKGSVVLSFKIKKNGELKNIRVEKKLCDVCDEEAIRLLRAGSKWKYVNDKRTTVTINF